MLTKTPYIDVEELHEERRVKNIKIIKEKFKKHLNFQKVKDALLFNEQRRGVFMYFKTGCEEIITSIRYPDILANIPDYYYDNNLYEFQDYGFQEFSLGKCGQLFYSKKYSHDPIIPSNKLTVSTLFKNESNEWIDFFIKYYKKQGVDCFMMHYNGVLNERLNLPKHSGVTYVEWNYPRIIAEGVNGGWNRNEHFQVGLFPVTNKKYIPTSKYTLAIDVDELFYVDDKTKLIEYLDNIQFNNDMTGLRVGCRWSFLDIENQNVDIKNVELERHKIIYSNKYTHPFIRLHRPCIHSIVDNNTLNLMHIVNVPFIGELYYPANSARYTNYSKHDTYKKVKIEF